MAHLRLCRAGEAAYHFLGQEDCCAYCGDPAETIDHTVPCWLVERNVELILHRKLFKVPACADCNRRAGKTIDFTFQQRKRRIARSLRRAHIRLLSAADWPDDELEEMGYQLRTYLLTSRARRAHLMARILELEGPLAPRGMPPVLLSRSEAFRAASEAVKGRGPLPMDAQTPEGPVAPP